ncbi:MAG: hypothetical protein IJP86_07500 [Synergistaceae bacterium]|nr:hypothetical protein [Synergistaceae bacterium]
MRKVWAWAAVMVMMLAVFAVSGCGGGSLDPQSGGTGRTSPFAYVDSYDIPAVLSGTWILTEGDGTAVSTTAGEADTLSLIMPANTQMVFSEVNISGDTGTALVYYSLKLRAFDEESIYRGDFDLNSYRSDDDAVKVQAVNLTHAGDDVWRAENSDGDVMILSFTAVNTLTMAWDGFKYLDNGDVRTKQYHCELECLFTKR